MNAARRHRALLAVTALAVIALASAAGLATARRHSGSPDLTRPPADAPGAVDPRVTDGDLATTVCLSGYTDRVRPPQSYTSGLKRKQLADQRYADKDAASYEEDHRVPLELGGSPTNPANLWPEPWEAKGHRLAAAGRGAESKDQRENRVHADLCAGRLTLAQAQAVFLGDW